MSNALVPELSVSNFQASLAFYCGVLDFSVRYQRPEEGSAYLALGAAGMLAELMIDQIGLGRDFAHGTSMPPPYGTGINLQIRVADLAPLQASLTAHHIALFLAVEERWYRKDTTEVGNRQFVVADPDGYLLRFYQDLGQRPL